MESITNVITQQVENTMGKRKEPPRGGVERLNSLYPKSDLIISVNFHFPNGD